MLTTRRNNLPELTHNCFTSATLAAQTGSSGQSTAFCVAICSWAVCNMYRAVLLNAKINTAPTTIYDIVTIKCHKPVGFYGPIAPPVPNANSSECPPSFDRCTPVLLVDCCCTLVLHSASRTAYHSIGGRLPEWQISKCISSVSFVRIESNFFYNTQETDAKK